MMLPIVSALRAFIAALFRSRASLCMEHLALRHHLAVYKQTIHRPRLRLSDRLFWVCVPSLAGLANRPGIRPAAYRDSPRHNILCWVSPPLAEYRLT
jgi:hypothetical protein